MSHPDETAAVVGRPAGLGPALLTDLAVESAYRAALAVLVALAVLAVLQG